MPNLPMSVLTVPTEIEGEVVPTSYEIKDATARAGAVNLIKDTVGWIGKNKIPFPYNLSDVSGSEITFTADANGVVDADGTTSDISSLYFSRRDGVAGNKMLLPAGTWKVVGGKSINVYLVVSCTENNAYKIIGKDTGNGFVFTLTEPTYIQISLHIYNMTVSHEKISPMVCTKEQYDLSPTYEPYHESVEEYAFPRSEQVILGAENLLRVKNTTNTSTMTQVRNADDSVTLNGTNTEASGLVAFALRNDNNYFLPKGRYRLFVKTDKAYTGRIVANVNATIGGSGVLLGSGDCNTPFEFEVASDSYPLGVYLSPYNNSACDNVTFYALLTLATDTNTVYQKPTLTNRELTEKKADDMCSAGNHTLYMIATAITPSNGQPEFFIPWSNPKKKNITLGNNFEVYMRKNSSWTKLTWSANPVITRAENGFYVGLTLDEALTPEEVFGFRVQGDIVFS